MIGNQQLCFYSITELSYSVTVVSDVSQQSLKIALKRNETEFIKM